jgi:hypothetical protein
MKATLLAVASLFLLALALAACGDGPTFTCPDQTMPCGYPDAGSDGGADADADH